MAAIGGFALQTRQIDWFNAIGRMEFAEFYFFLFVFLETLCF